MNALDIEHLFFSYQGTPVLKDVTFSIQEGQCIGIIGPNGGGKTTLLSLLMGFLTPQKGSIRILGFSPKQARRFIGYVPQNFRFDPQFPISNLEVVLTGCLHKLQWHGHYQKEDTRAALEALDKVGMLPFKNARFSELSGGQAQRVLLARALVSEPKILLLDEPTASIDPVAQKEIYSLLNALKGKMTLLMVTHDLKTAIDYVERVFCLQVELSVFSKAEICRHFALGLYHPPIVS